MAVPWYPIPGWKYRVLMPIDPTTGSPTDGTLNSLLVTAPTTGGVNVSDSFGRFAHQCFVARLSGFHTVRFACLRSGARYQAMVSGF